MKIDVIGLFADTARSQGYAQALLHHGYKIETAILISKSDGAVKGKPEQNSFVPAISKEGDIFQADFSIPLIKTLGELADNVVEISSGTVNHPDVIHNLERSALELVIYSGFGGEIVSSKVLRASPPMLHMHSGYLPEYRGSTTIYYSILEERKCAVSAIFLSEKIDTGDILKRVWYPCPVAGTEIDYVYDTAIRADTLIKVLKDWGVKKSFEKTAIQSENEGESYYVIHPVLKHLAILSLEKKETEVHEDIISS